MNEHPLMDGLTHRQLTPADIPAMMQLQDEVLALLPDPSWYYPAEEWEFTMATEAGEAYGYFSGNQLVAYAEMSPGEKRGEHSYAVKLGKAPERTYDFHDVMVAPEMRRRGIHNAFLRRFEALARQNGAVAIYATVDPGNGPSYRNFERAGYVNERTMPAYDGRLRRFYRLDL